MDQNDAEKVYLYHFKRTEELIASMGDNPQAINAFITNAYQTLSEKEPAFLWFSLGTIVSASVGQNLQMAKEAVIHSLGQMESSNIVLNAFSHGNQDIFKSIMPLYLTYDEIGVEGCKLLISSDFENSFQNVNILNALQNYEILKDNQSKTSELLDLNLNDPKVIEELFSQQENVALAHLIALEIMALEQNIAQDIYDEKFVNILLDPTLSRAGELFKLDEITILDKSYKFFDYIDNPADFDQRMAFAEILLEAIEDGISNGQFSQHQSDVLKMAEQALWMGNPYTASNLIGDVNGAYWGKLGDEHDQKVKDSVLAFLESKPAVEETAIISPIDTNENDIFSSVFTGEYEIVKVEMDPLAYFLAMNPNYEIIAHNVTELLNSQTYQQSPIYGIGRAYWNSDLPYMKDSTYFAIYNDGDYHYHQPYGEVRGITFPFMYDKTTGVPLTMPIKDTLGHYDHTSTIDTIYSNPEAFNQPTHINWNNPYWNQQIQLAKQEAIKSYFKSITVDSFMNAVTAPVTQSFHYDSTKAKLELKTNDVLNNNSGGIDFSELKDSHVNTGTGSYIPIISNMTLANGMEFERNERGSFSCTNCHSFDSTLFENAANSILNHI